VRKTTQEESLVFRSLREDTMGRKQRGFIDTRGRRRAVDRGREGLADGQEDKKVRKSGQGEPMLARSLRENTQGFRSLLRGDALRSFEKKEKGEG